MLERSSELRRQVPPASSEGSVGGSVLPLREHAPRRREHAPRRGEHAPRRGDTVGDRPTRGVLADASRLRNGWTDTRSLHLSDMTRAMRSEVLGARRLEVSEPERVRS